MLAACFVAALGFAPDAGSQPVNPPSLADLTTTGTAFYVFAETGEPTMEIMIVGAAKSGVYRVGTQTSLLRLLTLAGSTYEQPVPQETLIIDSRIEIRRRQGAEMALLYSAEPRELLIDVGRHPILQDGDLVMLDTDYERIKKRVTFRDVLELTSRVASVLAVVLLLAQRIN